MLSDKRLCRNRCLETIFFAVLAILFEFFRLVLRFPVLVITLGIEDTQLILRDSLCHLLIVIVVVPIVFSAQERFLNYFHGPDRRSTLASVKFLAINAKELQQAGLCRDDKPLAGGRPCDCSYHLIDLYFIYARLSSLVNSNIAVRSC